MARSQNVKVGLNSDVNYSWGKPDKKNNWALYRLSTGLIWIKCVVSCQYLTVEDKNNYWGIIKPYWEEYGNTKRTFSHAMMQQNMFGSFVLIVTKIAIYNTWKRWFLWHCTIYFFTSFMQSTCPLKKTSTLPLLKLINKLASVWNTGLFAAVLFIIIIELKELFSEIFCCF
jgi:hypothetical protein